ncbi:MAG: signal peptidase I [Helcococcus sp.]|nr:signal peptidase I [Helcococcus sp.]
MDERILRKRRKRQSNNAKKIKRIFTYVILIAIILILITLIVDKYFFSVIKIEGNSMQRTFYEGDKILVKKFNIDAEDIKQDDIIYFQGEDNRFYVKRVIGLPGDIVEVINNKIFINGKQKIEDYTRGDETQVYDQDKWFVGENEFFVLGDNRYRDLSKDSRLFGTININQIKGVFVMNFSER